MLDERFWRRYLCTLLQLTMPGLMTSYSWKMTRPSAKSEYSQLTYGATPSEFIQLRYVFSSRLSSKFSRPFTLHPNKKLKNEVEKAIRIERLPPMARSNPNARRGDCWTDWQRMPNSTCKPRSPRLPESKSSCSPICPPAVALSPPCAANRSPKRTNIKTLKTRFQSNLKWFQYPERFHGNAGIHGRDLLEQVSVHLRVGNVRAEIGAAPVRSRLLQLVIDPAQQDGLRRQFHELLDALIRSKQVRQARAVLKRDLIEQTNL